MPQSDAGELFPDRLAIQAALERRTRAALLRRVGPARATPIERGKARGIGFAVDLVRAILDGRKTQTRRLMRPQPDATAAPPPPDACPVARAGELLYVREPWLRVPHADGDRLLYAADAAGPTSRRFKPAMYMPRAAARLWLRVSNVRAERLAEITPADLAAEGLPPGQSLAAVWDTFYTDPGQRSADNPWVWVIGFAVEGEC